MIEPQQITPEIIESLREHRIPITHYHVCWAIGRTSWQVAGFTGIVPLESWGATLVSTEVDIYSVAEGVLSWHYGRGVWRAEG